MRFFKVQHYDALSAPGITVIKDHVTGGPGPYTPSICGVRLIIDIPLPIKREFQFDYGNIVKVCRVRKWVRLEYCRGLGFSFAHGTRGDIGSRPSGVPNW